MIKRSLKFVALLSLILTFAHGASAQLTAPTQTVTLTLVGAESLTAACTPTAVTFASAAGTTVPGSVPVSCTATWNLAPTRTSLTGYSGFAVSTTALANGTNLIPTSAISVSYNGGAATPCTSTLTAATVIGAGAGCGSSISGNLLTNNFNSTHTDSIAISIAEPAVLPAGSYTGSYLIVYQAI